VGFNLNFNTLVKATLMACSSAGACVISTASPRWTRTYQIGEVAYLRQPVALLGKLQDAIRRNPDAVERRPLDANNIGCREFLSTSGATLTPRGRSILAPSCERSTK
jgi:hypothetical protein